MLEISNENLQERLRSTNEFTVSKNISNFIQHIAFARKIHPCATDLKNDAKFINTKLDTQKPLNLYNNNNVLLVFEVTCGSDIVTAWQLCLA